MPCTGGLKDLVLLQLRRRSLLWLRFDLWQENFQMPSGSQKKKKNNPHLKNSPPLPCPTDDRNVSAVSLQSVSRVSSFPGVCRGTLFIPPLRDRQPSLSPDGRAVLHSLLLWSCGCPPLRVPVPRSLIRTSVILDQGPT